MLTAANFTALGTQVTDAITAGLPAALLVVGAILGISMGIKIFKRLAK
jgi:hypothetical protein